MAGLNNWSWLPEPQLETIRYAAPGNFSIELWRLQKSSLHY